MSAPKADQGGVNEPGKAIEEYRCSNGLSCREMAKALHVSISRYSEIRSGKRLPTIRTLKRAHSFGIDAARLLS